MSTWMKIFTDGTREPGSDIDIDTGRASWSRGKLENIESCVLTGFGSQISLEIPNTDWHQFDRMEVPVATGKHESIRRGRVLQAQIKVEHVGCFIQELYTGRYLDKGDPVRKRWFSILEELEASSPVNSDYIEIRPKHLDKWFTVMLDDVGIHISFSDKGSTKNG
jgi:hypothetical protein